MEFSEHPGAHERHLMRRHDNPLFPVGRRTVTTSHLNAARQKDAQELQEFMERFHGVVECAVNLESQTDSGTLLKLKEDLDRSYEECAGLAGDQRRVKEAIRHLIDTIMRAIWQEADGDPLAQQKLREEEQARALHFSLLEYPLVADLLSPRAVIGEAELVPSLLTASAEALDAVLQIFTPEQIGLIYQDARQLLDGIRDTGPRVESARERLRQIETAAIAQVATGTVN
ncbi:MAG TPA: hypothetical protein ENJ05_09340 [Thiotrichales bacterium]|nr:hypothetical protein [Thiotrichales bacterium]